MVQQTGVLILDRPAPPPVQLLHLRFLFQGCNHLRLCISTSLQLVNNLAELVLREFSTQYLVRVHPQHISLILTTRLDIDMRSKFKDEHPFEKRKAEAERIRQKYVLI